MAVFHDYAEDNNWKFQRMPPMRWCRFLKLFLIQQNAIDLRKDIDRQVKTLTSLNKDERYSRVSRLLDTRYSRKGIKST